MKIKIMEAARRIAKYQLNPVDRALNELRDRGYTFTRNPKADCDYTLVQTTIVGKDKEQGKQIVRDNTPVILLDDCASTGTHKMRFVKWLPDHCVGYIKKQLLRDRELYLTSYPRKRYHYYLISQLGGEGMNRATGIDKNVDDRVLSLVHLGWSLALMERPGVQIATFPKFSGRDIDIHYSVKTKHTTKVEKENLGKIDNHYAFHRVGCTLEVERIVRKHKMALSGPCKGSEYLRRMSRSKVCVSPWGLGEVCFRDFEAICWGALMIKPDMSYIETWPDVYQPWKTYIPCKYDWSDLEEIVVEVIQNYKKYQDIAVNAFNLVKSVWDNNVFADQFDAIMRKVTEGVADNEQGGGYQQLQEGV